MPKYVYALLLVLGGTPLVAQNALLDSIQMLGGSGVDAVVSITPDNAGNLFVLGSTQSPDFPVTATFGKKPAKSSISGDTFVAKIHLADWSLVWSVLIRPSAPLALTADNAGAVYITGHTDSPADFPTTPGAFTSTATGPLGQLYVLKLDPSGSRVIYSALLAPYELYANAPIAVDSQGQGYVATEGQGPITPGALFPAITVGNRGAYVAKLSANGSKVIFCTYLATSSTISSNAVAVDDQQNVFVAGTAETYNSAFPSTPGVIQPNHGGSSDAFLMKFRADGSKLEFATLLGGAGGDSANFVHIAADGSIYLAGNCESGSASSANNPFPTTPDAAFRTFHSFNGFVARLSPDASSLLFSTYVSSTSSGGLMGFVLSTGQLFAAYPLTVSRGFLGFNYYPTADIISTAVQVFDADSGALAGPALQIPALPSDSFAISGSDLLIASNRSLMYVPVPSTLTPIGPLDPPASNRADIAIGKFDLTGTPDHDIQTDRGYIFFDAYPGATLQQTLNITSSVGSVPFQIFTATDLITSISTSSGVTPASLNVTPIASTPGYVPALLLVSPRVVPSIQILPVFTYTRQIQVSAQADLITLPADGGPARGTIQVTAVASSQVTLLSTPVSVPFQLYSPNGAGILTFDSSTGTTPATIGITGQIDSLAPGRTATLEVDALVNGVFIARSFVSLYRPGPPPLVTPTFLQLSGILGQAAPTASVRVTPPDSTTTFQALSVPAGITISPSSGTGPALLTVTADPTQFPLSTTTRVSFTLQVGTTLVPVSANVYFAQYPLGVLQAEGNVSPGKRLRVRTYGVAANLPTTGSWTELSPAPTEWNGYSFVYRSASLPILSADPANLQFDVQLPYDLDLTARNAPVVFLAPDGTELSRGITSGQEMPTAMEFFRPDYGPASAFKQDGSAVSFTNPVSPGDIIRLLLVGTGITDPPIQAGLLPDPGAIVSPVAPIYVEIGGKPATVIRQALDANYIGVTDLDILVPNVASGLEMLGLQVGSDRLNLVQVWIAN